MSGDPELRAELHRIITPPDGAGLDWLDLQVREIDKLDKGIPHSIRLRTRCSAAISDLNCFMLALSIDAAPGDSRNRPAPRRPCTWRRSLCLLKNPQMPQISQIFGNVVVAHPPMITFLSAIVSFLSFRIRSRAPLELEVIAQRHQLGVLKRRRPGRARFFFADRLLWFWLCLAADHQRRGAGQADDGDAMAP